MVNRDQARESLAAYALGALGDAEARALEAELRDWPEGRAELGSLLATAGSLAALAEAQTPAPALRERTLAAARNGRGRGSLLGRVRGLALPAPPGGWTPRMALATSWATAMTVLVVVFGVLAFEGDDEVIGGVWVAIPAIEGAEAYSVELNDQIAAVVFRGLTEPVPEGQRYQVWRVLADGSLVADKTFIPSPAGWAPIIAARIEGEEVVSFAISLEPITDEAPLEPTGQLFHFPLR